MWLYQISSLCLSFYKPTGLTKYNYLLSAALDGGAELVVFVVSMVFQGGGSEIIDFPTQVIL
jgi:hypothetical protein